MFLDGGYAAARVFATRVFADELRQATPGNSVDYKTTLQEVLQAGPPAGPSNITRSRPMARRMRGNSRSKRTWKTGKARGRGSSIKAAEMMAAAEVLTILKAAESKAAKRAGKN